MLVTRTSLLRQTPGVSHHRGPCVLRNYRLPHADSAYSCDSGISEAPRRVNGRCVVGRHVDLVFMSATLGVGGALGLSLAVFITEAFTWHMIFWVPVGLHTVGTILVLVFLPESLVRTPARFLLLTSVIVFTGWGALQLRTRERLVDLRVSARPYVLFTNLASIHDRVLHVRDVTHVSAIAHGTGAYGVRSRSLDDTNRSRHGTRGCRDDALITGVRSILRAPWAKDHTICGCGRYRRRG